MFQARRLIAVSLFTLAAAAASPEQSRWKANTGSALGATKRSAGSSTFANGKPAAALTSFDRAGGAVVAFIDENHASQGDSNMARGATKPTNIWVNSLLIEDHPEIGDALRTCGPFRMYQSNSATGPAKLVVAFGPFANLQELKCVAKVLASAFLLDGVGETDNKSVIFVGIERFDEHQIVAVQKIAHAIESATKIEHVRHAMATARR
jgi:hypothetical protein